VLGNVTVTASGIVNGIRLAGVSSSVAPVFNGTTNVGDIATATRSIIAVTSLNLGNVSFIDTSTNPPTVIASPTSGGNQPTATVITPDGKTAIVDNFGAGAQFRFFDITQNPPVVLGDISSGPIFASMILSKDGRFAFGVYPNICSIDVANRKVISNLSLAVGAAAITPDGTTLITADPRTGSIAVLSVSSRGVLQDNGVRLNHSLFAGNTYTSGIDISPNGHLLLMPNPFDNSVSVLKIDAAHNLTDPGIRIPVCCRPWGVAFTKDGSKAYIVNSSSGDVAVLHIDANDNVTDTGTRISMSGALVQQGPESATISISQDGRAYVVNSFTNVNGNIVNLSTVTIIDTRTDTVLGTVQVGSDPTSVGAQ